MSKLPVIPEHDDVLCGRLSNIPDCCIRFFLTQFWKWLVNKRYSLTYFAIDARITGQDAGYVRCPKCILLRRKSEIVRCRNWCGFMECGWFPESYEQNDLSENNG